MANHTPEPWTVCPAGDGENDSDVAEIHDGFGRTATVYGDEGQDVANAARIVACVNACVGIPTEALQRGALGEVTRALIDAAVMLENIERNRNMPPEARTLQQYVALGRQMRVVLATLRGEG